MIRVVVLSAVLAFFMSCASYAPSSMNQADLVQHIERLATKVQSTPNVVEFEYAGVRMACVSDADHDRMRIITPVAKASTLEPGHLQVMMIANFHTTLDARYALSKDVLFAAFLHPLSTLTVEELESGLRQVAALARNFGTSYSSDELIYGAESEAGTETEL